MKKTTIAREAVAIGRVLGITASLDPYEEELHLANVRARLAALGLSLEAVAKAGILALKDVPSDVVAKIEADEPAYSKITTNNWNDQVSMALTICGAYLSPVDRTFLEIAAYSGNLDPTEFACVERIVAKAFSALEEDELGW